MKQGVRVSLRCDLSEELTLPSGYSLLLLRFFSTRPLLGLGTGFLRSLEELTGASEELDNSALELPTSTIEFLLDIVELLPEITNLQ